MGQNTFLGGKDICFYYTFETNVPGQNTIWGALPPWVRAWVTSLFEAPVARNNVAATNPFLVHMFA